MARKLIKAEQIDEYVLNRVAQLKQEGLEAKIIALQLGISESSVIRYWQIHENRQMQGK
jgi:DNA-binding MurR/RpiR family transcriptional regulator